MHSFRRAGRFRASVGLCLLLATACAPGAVRPPEGVSRNEDAILILPGFGYSSSGRTAFERFAAEARTEGFDVYVADYVRRDGLQASGAAILEFIKAEGLDQYPRLHIFAFIAGAWSLNPALQTARLPNLKSLVYDRSPLQERAPRVIAQKLPLAGWLTVGEPLFEVARTPYTPVAPQNVSIGLVIESRATALVRYFQDVAASYGPVRASIADFQQPCNDATYIAYDHDSLYDRFYELRPLLLTFFRTGKFPDDANRTPPDDFWRPADAE